MYGALNLEWIDAEQDRNMHRLTGEKQVHMPWVAELTGIGASGFIRRFLRPKKDYGQSNSAGSRGIKLCFLLSSGKTYEAYSWLTWKRQDRYFCKVTADGRVEEIDEREALARVAFGAEVPSARVFGHR